MKFLRVRNWDQFQQYKDRDPKWIKFHRDILDDYEIEMLPEPTQLHLFKIWLLAAKLDNKIPADANWIGRRIGASSKVDIEQLVTDGFLSVYEDVQGRTETYLETEEETEEETETEKRRAPKGRRFSAQEVTDDWMVAAKCIRPDLDPDETLAKFSDYWTAKTGQGATKRDWLATWRNWLRNEHKPKSPSRADIWKGVRI